MKKLIIFMLLFSYLSIFTSQESEIQDFELLQEAIEIVSSMSDNIANLVIQHKKETNSPELTKQECIALIEKITSFVIIILKKQKLKKTSRSISLYEPNDIPEKIDALANEIIDKIKLG